MINFLYKTKKNQKTFTYTREVGTTLDPIAREVIQLIVAKPSVQLKNILQEIGLFGELERFVEKRFKFIFKQFTRNTTLNSYENKDLIQRVSKEEAMIELEGEDIFVDVYNDLNIIRINNVLIEKPDDLEGFVYNFIKKEMNVPKLKGVSEKEEKAVIETMNVKLDFVYSGKMVVDNFVLDVPETAYRQVSRQMRGSIFDLRPFSVNDTYEEDIDCKPLTKDALKAIFEEEVVFNGWKTNAKDGLISISAEGHGFKTYNLKVWDNMPMFYKKFMTEEEVIEKGYKELILKTVSKKCKLVKHLSDEWIIDLINEYGENNITLINNIVNKKPEIFQNMEVATWIKNHENVSKFNFEVDSENILRILQKIPKEFKILFVNTLSKDSITNIDDQWLIKFMIENELQDSLSKKQMNTYKHWSDQQDSMLKKYFGIVQKIKESGINERLGELTSKELNKLKINKQFRKWLEKNIDLPKGDSFKRIIEPAAITRARKCLSITNSWIKLMKEKETAQAEITEEE